jgi:hypothetical protein
MGYFTNKDEWFLIIITASFIYVGNVGVGVTDECARQGRMVPDQHCFLYLVYLIGEGRGRQAL